MCSFKNRLCEKHIDYGTNNIYWQQIGHFMIDGQGKLQTNNGI